MGKFDLLKKMKSSTMAMIVGLLTAISAQAQTPAYEVSQAPAVFTSFTGGSSLGMSDANDDVSNNFSLPFVVTYGGNNYTSFRVSTNGWIALSNFSSSGNSTPNNAALYSSSLNPNVVLAPWWDDLELDAPATLRYKTSGSYPNRVFEVQFLNYLAFRGAYSGPRLNFKVSIYEANDQIVFSYGAKTAGTRALGESASIGLEWGSGGPGNFLDATTGSMSMSHMGLSSDQFPSGYAFTFKPITATSPLSAGTYNVGAGGHFCSLTAAFAAVNQKGISGPVTFNLTDAVYSPTQGNLFPLTLTNVAGTSATNTLTINGNNATIQGVNGINAGTMTFYGSSNTVITTSLNEALLLLAGTDYTTVQNLNFRTTTGALSADRGIRLSNVLPNDGANFNTIKNVNIALDRTNNYSIGIEQSSTAFTSTMSGTNSYNKYQDIVISNVYSGIYLSGNASYPDKNCIIGTSNCNTWNQIGGLNANDIGNSSSSVYGIQAANQANVKIFNNVVRNLTATGTATVDGILLYNGYMSGTVSGDSSIIYSNKIHTLTNTNSNAQRVTGLRASLNANPGSRSFIFNNSISDLQSASTVTTSRRIVGIMLQDAAGGVGAEHNLDNNSVSITPNNIACSNACFEVGTATGPVYKIRNNIFANFTAAQTAGKHYCWATMTNSIGPSGSVSNYNDLYIANPTNGFIGLGSADQATLTQWRTHMNADLNSISIDPGFAGLNDLHTSSLALNGSADMSNITWIGYDMDCNPRGYPHDMGADNFTPLTYDVGAFQLVSPMLSGCYNTPQVLAVAFKNNAALALDMSQNPVTVTVAVTAPDASVTTYTAVVNSGVLSGTETRDIALTTNFNMSLAGTYIFNASATLAGDENTANDAMSAVSRTVVAPQTLPSTELTFTSFIGTNLSTVFPQWSEAQGASLPAGNTSLWTNSVAFGQTTARINLNSNIRREWLVGPKVVPTACTRLRFRAAITAPGTAANFQTGMNATDDKVCVMISTDCGLSFFPIYTFDNTNYPNYNLSEYSVNLSAYVGQEIIVAFYATDGIGDDVPNYDFHLDNIQIREVNALDLQNLSVQAPQCYSATSFVNVNVKNMGCGPINFGSNPLTVTLNYTKDGIAQSAVSTTVSNGVLAEDYAQTVSVPFNMSEAGNYVFTAVAQVLGDDEKGNNTAADVVKIVPLVAVTPAVSTMCLNDILPLQASGDDAKSAIGTATTTNSSTSYPAVYGASYENTRHQVLFLSHELNALGLYEQAKMKEIALSVAALNGIGNMKNFKIKIAHTTDSVMTADFIAGPFLTVYSAATYTPTLGLNTHTFSTPFEWNGTDNVVLDFSFENDPTDAIVSYTSNASTHYTQTAVPTVTYFYTDNVPSHNQPFGVASDMRPNITFTVESVPTWSPKAGLYLDAAATIPYNDGLHVKTVYVKSPPVTTYNANFMYVNCLRQVKAKVKIVPNLVTTNASVCNGGAIDLQGLVTDLSDTTGTVNFYSQLSDAQNQVNAFASSTVYPSSTTTYYVRKEVGNCSDIKPITVESISVKNIAPTDGTVYSADYEVVEGVWTHYYDDRGTSTLCDDYLLLSLKKNGNNIGTIGDGVFQVEIAGQGGVAHIPNNVGNYVENADWFVMNRFWNVHPTAQPLSDLNVKFYYTGADFDAVVNAPNSIVATHQDMKFFKINGSQYNPDPSLGHIGVPAASGYNQQGYWQYTADNASTHDTWAYALVGDGHSAEYTIASFSGGGGGGGTAGGAFPIVLGTFTGISQSGANILNWTTTMELNFDHFEVLRSQDGFAFENIGRVMGTGNSNETQKYTFTDAKPLQGANYYQLKMVDKDGSENFSSVLTVKVESRYHFTFYPNPARDIVYLDFKGVEGEMNVRLTDAMGQQVADYIWDADGVSLKSFDVSTLPAGIYMYVIEFEDWEYSGKILIQK